MKAVSAGEDVPVRDSSKVDKQNAQAINVEV